MLPGDRSRALARVRFRPLVNPQRGPTRAAVAEAAGSGAFFVGELDGRADAAGLLGAVKELGPESSFRPPGGPKEGLLGLADWGIAVACPAEA